ncbi:ComEC family competence protein [bacterium]|nr:ComEC family competence protein [bacterium]
MYLLRTPPAVKLLIPFCAGIVLGVRWDLSAPWLLALSALGLVLWLHSYRQQHHRLSAALAFLLVLLLAAVRTTLHYHHAAVNEIRRFVSTDAVAVEGVLSSAVVNKFDHCSFVLKVDSVWSRTHRGPAQGRVYVQLYDTTAVLTYGDRLLLRGFLRRPAGERNPGDFDYSRYLAAQGIFATLSVFTESPLLLDHDQGGRLDQRVFMPLAGFIHQLLYKALPAQQAALLFGLLVGDRSAVAREVEEDFRNAGVIHVLSVSGMHVGFVVAALFFLLKWLPVRPALRTLLLLVGIWFYAHLTGLDSPVARAALMTGLFLVAPLLQRRADPVNVIAVAAVILLLLHPLQ